MRLIDADALNIRSYCRWFDDSDDVRVVERMIREAPTIAPPPNPPLTLEELREMDGEPVFCFSKRVSEDSAWGIVCIRDNVPYVRTMQDKGKISRFFYLTTYGTAWLAYHHKPEDLQ